jgi:hypothetical protein
VLSDLFENLGDLFVEKNLSSVSMLLSGGTPVDRFSAKKIRFLPSAHNPPVDRSLRKANFELKNKLSETGGLDSIFEKEGLNLCYTRKDVKSAYVRGEPLFTDRKNGREGIPCKPRHKSSSFVHGIHQDIEEVISSSPFWYLS